MAEKSQGNIQLTPSQFFREYRRRFLDQMPKKRHINLATVNIRRINWFIAVPAILLIVLAAGLFSKIAVIDRMALAQEERMALSRLQTTLGEEERRLEGYDTLMKRYAHYTFSGMTEEELDRVDRGSVMELTRRFILSNTRVDSWTLRGNTLTLTVEADSLQAVNQLTQELLDEPLVEYCSVSSASTTETETGDESVIATLSVIVAAPD